MRGRSSKQQGAPGSAQQPEGSDGEGGRGAARVDEVVILLMVRVRDSVLLIAQQLHGDQDTVAEVVTMSALRSSSSSTAIF